MTIDINDPATIAAKADIFDVLDTSPNEVPALLAALKEGRIDGTVYSGACCCLIGTLAAAAGLNWQAVPDRDRGLLIRGALARDERSPAEQWFIDIEEGDTPETSERVADTVQWVEEWMAKRAEATSK